ncbi:uncharacterized protein DEA37_0001086 [Paragonimus westermani]|uniref:TMEM62 Ig-like domain-containing protein n=1 Tax=Paragonimus westermani TaxID=34504 RepID=A0A5J4NRB5_9TREM|nr:uncharacterized protein DEA37_0001086 [Paragonimus westermani]
MTFYSRILSAVVFCLITSAFMHFVYNFADRREVARVNTLKWPSRLAQKLFNETPLSDRPNNLLWFVQVTDLHLSRYQDISRMSDFQRFCTDVIPLLRPELVSISGDLTDARSALHITSIQNPEEWAEYEKIVRKSGVLNHTHFFDLRGNHGNSRQRFGNRCFSHQICSVSSGQIIPLITSAVTFKSVESRTIFVSLVIWLSLIGALLAYIYRKYGVQGGVHVRSYLHTVRKPFGNYSFVNLDASPKSGVAFPLNFFGELTPGDQELIVQFVNKTKRSNQTFWFGHYPTSTIVSTGLNLRALLGQSAFAYFCGHLHTFMHLLPRLYTLQLEGYLELELGDWRDDRYYRIVAVDHDLVSFVDIQMPRENTESHWPVVLVTNPKNANFLLPHKEPVNRIVSSTHIRILAWSDQPIVQVAVFIDSQYLGNATSSCAFPDKPHPLFALSWNASQWADHLQHQLKVLVVDAFGRQRIQIQSFLVNGIPSWQFGAVTSFVLQTDHTFNLRLVFYLCELLICGGLIIFKFIQARWTRYFICKSRFFLGLRRFVHCNRVFIPVLCLLIYQCFGPIFMGFLIGYHFGIVFSFGIFVAGSFVMEALTYVYQMIQVISFTLLYLLYVIWYCGRHKTPVLRSAVSIHDGSTCPPSDHLLSEPVTDAGTCRNSTLRLICNIPLPLFIHATVYSLLQLLFIFTTITLPYGIMATVLSPGRITLLLIPWFIASQFNQIVTGNSLSNR